MNSPLKKISTAVQSSSDPAGGGVHNVEELDGGQGREVFFRPHRYRASELGPLLAKISVRLGEAEIACTLHDISQNGAAVSWPEEHPVEAGAQIAHLEIRFDDHVAYSGEAKVSSVRAVNNAVIVGLQFVELLIDLEDVIHLRAIKAWTTEHDAGTSQQVQAPWRVSGHERFKSLVSEFNLFLLDAEQHFGELETSLPWHVVHGDQASPARDALISQLKATFGAEVIRASEEIDAAIRSVPPAHVKPLMAYSQRYLQRYFMMMPCMHRAFVKPFAYPGDYEVMNFLYERPFEGTTLFAKALSVSFDQTKAPSAVRYRKDLVKRQLRAMIESRGASERPLRILSVAAGPAQELCELLSEMQEVPMPVEIVLFDQDKGALGYAYRRLKPIVDAKFAKQVRVLYLHESIKRLLRDAELFVDFGRFDAIYSVGLTDYLGANTAMVLMRNLVNRLAEGSVALIANMAPENPSRWYMEHHLDWFLTHRTRAELLDLARRAAPTMRWRILEEESGVNPFVEIARD